MAASARTAATLSGSLTTCRMPCHAMHPSCMTPCKSSPSQLQRGGKLRHRETTKSTHLLRDRASIQLPAPRVPTSEAAGNVLGAGDGTVCYRRGTSERTCHNSHLQTVMVGEGQRATVAHASHTGNRQPGHTTFKCLPQGTQLCHPPKGCTTSQNCATSWAPRPQTHESRLNPYPHHC